MLAVTMSKCVLQFLRMSSVVANWLHVSANVWLDICREQWFWLCRLTSAVTGPRGMPMLVLMYSALAAKMGNSATAKMSYLPL